MVSSQERKRYDRSGFALLYSVTGIAMSDATGDQYDVSVMFDRYKDRLRRTVRLRLDRRLTGIVDSSGVLEMAREEVKRRGGAPTEAAPGGFSLAAPDRW